MPALRRGVSATSWPFVRSMRLVEETAIVHRSSDKGMWRIKTLVKEKSVGEDVKVHTIISEIKTTRGQAKKHL